MKKIASKLFLVMLAMTPFLFTSCDEDEEIAYTLEGTWEGKMYTTSTWDNYTYAISQTVIDFDKDPYRYAKGNGHWVDYYSNAPWDYVANHISWSVRDKVIEIHLIEENYTFFVEDYSLNSGMFKGRIYDGDSYIDFTLRHTSSPYWDNYRWYDEDYYYDYYYNRYRSNNISFDGNESTRRSMKVVGAPHRNFVPVEVTEK